MQAYHVDNMFITWTEESGMPTYFSVAHNTCEGQHITYLEFLLQENIHFYAKGTKYFHNNVS